MKIVAQYTTEDAVNDGNLIPVSSLGGMYIFDRESGELVLREDHPQPDRITPYTVRIGRKNHKIWGICEGGSVILMHPEEY